MAQISAAVGGRVGKKSLVVKSDDLNAIREGFYGLDEVKKNAQMSGD